MKDSKDYFFEDLLKETEQELEALSEIDDLFDGNDVSADLSTAKNIREKFMTAEEEGVEFPMDGYMELSVSEDEMEVYADFFPPSEGKQRLSTADAEDIINEKNITHGVDSNTVKEALFKCNTEVVPIKNVLIAEGTPPIREIPAHYVIEEKLLGEPGGKKQKEDDTQGIDFRERTPFVLVKTGEVLARMAEKQDGEFGYTVFGKVLPFAKEKVSTPVPGKNTEAGNEIITASLDGRFEMEGDTFYINEVLQVDTDVDYSTGNIDFPGDVILKGQVKDGFKIVSGGSIFCGQTLDASEIIGEKDLIVKQGIIGRKKGSIKVNGRIKAKFIENCYVEAKDTIYVDVGIMNSAVYTTKRVELGKKGIIVGGSLYAQNGVSAAQVGTSMGPRTEIYCGIDYTVSNKMEWIRDNSVKLAFKLKQVEERLKTAKTGKDQLVLLRDKIKESIHKMNEAAQTLVFKLDKNDDAEIIVKGNVFPGVYIEICHYSYVVGREMKGIRFKLNKEKGIIIPEKLMR